MALSSHSDRHFKNPFLADDIDKVVDTTSSSSTTGGELKPEIKQKLDNDVRKLFAKLEKELPQMDRSDTSVYTGVSGVALLYGFLCEKCPELAKKREDFLVKALRLIEPALQHPQRKRMTFLCGDSGLYCVAATLYQAFGQAEKAKECIDEWSAMALQSSACDEVLFGRSGYLYALLFLQKHFGSHCVPGKLISEVVGLIVKSGKDLAKKERSKCPLMYMWHDSYYLGAAHGLAGIFVMLMRSPIFAEDSDLRRLVKESVDFLMTLRFPSGNYPSSLRSRDSDKLVHWCHGAPGFIHMFLQAYKVYKDEAYLKEAIGCADVIWERGLLKKGYGICHGAAGNGYALLMLWQTTHDQKYLCRALKFAEWIGDYGSHGCRIADRPLSLFEGLAGAIYFLADLKNPAKAEFPAFS